MSESLAPQKRHVFKHAGQTIYEWDQTVDDVNVYVTLPKGVPTKAFTCSISVSHLVIGIKGCPPYLDHDLGGRVLVDSCFWTIEDGVLHVSLQKQERAKNWEGALAGHTLDAYTSEEESKRLLLERFQAENPGFDFSGAELTGACPDPSAFLGGMGK